MINKFQTYKENYLKKKPKQIKRIDFSRIVLSLQRNKNKILLDKFKN